MRQWPARSRDLDPIENMWNLLKIMLYRDYEGPPKGMIELLERLQETWRKITKEGCQKFIETMPKRCQGVIDAEGYWFDY